MILIVGLGNPGKKYENNRHNVGYMVIDKLKNLKTEKLKNVIFAKTNVFMNESGKAVKKLVEKYHKNHRYHGYHELYIIHDDLDIPSGKFKIQYGRGPRAHKGVDSVERVLGSNEFWRVRIGIENRTQGTEHRISGEEYVLQDFLPEEKKVLEKVVGQIAEELVKRLKE